MGLYDPMRGNPNGDNEMLLGRDTLAARDPAAARAKAGAPGGNAALADIENMRRNKESDPMGESSQSNVSGASSATGMGAGQGLSDAMKPKPGNYVVADEGNVAGGAQYVYSVDSQGMVQFTSPITGKKITLGPSETAAHKQRAYASIMKQIAKAKVS